MPDLFSQFGQPQQANPYMWPPMQGAFGWGKQGLMGAAGAGELPAQAQGQGVPGGLQGFTPPSPPQMPQPDFSQLQNTPQPGQQPVASAAPAPPDMGAGPPGLQLGLSGAPQDPTIAGQVQGPMPGVPGGVIGARGAVSPADYMQPIQQAMAYGKIPFGMQMPR
jgi:hypothetical protein